MTWRAVWTTLAGVAGGVALVWLALLVALWRGQPEALAGREALRLLPDLLRMLRGLAGDRAVPASVRWRLWLTLGYLASPLDLVPDFLPVIGYADDVVVVILVLRSVTRRAGSAALERHWPGSAAGLASVRRLAGVH